MLFPPHLQDLPGDLITYPPDHRDHPLAEAFRQKIAESAFPCVGAKSALSRGRLVSIVVDDIANGANDNRVHTALLGFVARYRSDPRLFQSFAVIFAGSHSTCEQAFERHLWARIQALCDRDAGLGHAWDGRVTADGEDPHFSLSVAGEGFFVVGLHPNASRPARRFSAPVLVFNLHDQFERLRQEGKYEKLRASILERDELLSGSINPMLARHGSVSEARQYSGRSVEDDWQCPFHPPQAKQAH